MPRKITVQDILTACEATVPEIERISNWYGYRSDGFPWSVLASHGRVHLHGVGWLTKVDSYQEPKPYNGWGNSSMTTVIIFKVDGDEQLFMKKGWWNSWDADPYEGGLEKVERYEKTVVAYRKVD